jgi:hypothetical protein
VLKAARHLVSSATERLKFGAQRRSEVGLAQYLPSVFRFVILNVYSGFEHFSDHEADFLALVAPMPTSRLAFREQQECLSLSSSSRYDQINLL